VKRVRINDLLELFADKNAITHRVGAVSSKTKVFAEDGERLVGDGQLVRGANCAKRDLNIRGQAEQATITVLEDGPNLLKGSRFAKMSILKQLD